LNRIGAVWAVAAILAVVPAGAQFGGFGGPSILSRGGGAPGRTSSRPIRLRPYVGLQGVYFSDLNEGSNQIINQPGGLMTNFGLQGSASRKRDFGSISYTGNVVLAGNRTLNGTNHNLMADYGRQLSPRWTMFLGQSALVTDQLLLGQQTRFSDNPGAQIVNPSVQFFDSRSYQLSSAGGFTYQKSARTSFSMSGGAMTLQPRGRGLIGVNLFQAQGSMMYRLNRRQGIGLNYNFTTFNYRRDFGETYLNSSMVIYHHQVSPRWMVTLAGGLYRVESERLTRVAVDPFIASLTGQTSVIEAFHSVTTGVTTDVGIAGRFRHSTVGLNYNRGIVPGNGVLLTSRQDAVYGHYSFLGLRNWSLSVSGNVLRYSAITQVIPPFQSYWAGIGASRRLTSFMHFNTNVGLMRTNLLRVQGGSGFRQDRFMVTGGIVFSPGDVPLSIF
jgi:hypothetical protein